MSEVLFNHLGGLGSNLLIGISLPPPSCVSGAVDTVCSTQRLQSVRSAPPTYWGISQSLLRLKIRGFSMKQHVNEGMKHDNRQNSFSNRKSNV